MTISYKEFLDDWIGMNRWLDDKGKAHSTPMSREDYYKMYMNGLSPREFYEQLLKCPSFTASNTA